jgi:hypothetical protein
MPTHISNSDRSGEGLLDQLARIARELDPVPERVSAQAREAFARRACAQDPE